MTFYELILLNAKDYLGTTINVYINVILIAIATALSIACFFINYHKSYTVIAIKQLLRHGATSEEKAVTLSALRLQDLRGLKFALNRGGQLTRIISRVGVTKQTYEEYLAAVNDSKHAAKDKTLSKAERRKAKRLVKKPLSEKIDFSVAKFYIPEENLKRAEMLKDKENPTILRTALICVFIFAICVCLMLLMPEILRLTAKLINEEF